MNFKLLRLASPLVGFRIVKNLYNDGRHTGERTRFERTSVKNKLRMEENFIGKTAFSKTYFGELSNLSKFSGGLGKLREILARHGFIVIADKVLLFFTYNAMV